MNRGGFICISVLKPSTSRQYRIRNTVDSDSASALIVSFRVRRSIFLPGGLVALLWPHRLAGFFLC